MKPMAIRKLLLHDLRQQRCDQLQFVLRLHLGDVRIGAAGKGQCHADSAGGIAVRGHVQQTIKTRHGLLDNLRHRVFNSLGRGARIGGADEHRGWRDDRIT
jgi:hypothetical protein